MTVLVACNDSLHGAAALRAGVMEATRRRLDLAVLVLNPGDTLPDVLAAELAALPPEAPAPTVTFRPADDEPSDAILDAADAVHATLVTIGTRNRSSEGTFVLGMTTQRVLLDASAPVLVVKATYPEP